MGLNKKNPFQKELEKRFGNDDYQFSAFMRGNKKLSVNKEYVKDTYDIEIEEFAYYARALGFKIMDDEDRIIIFK